MNLKTLALFLFTAFAPISCLHTAVTSYSTSSAFSATAPACQAEVKAQAEEKRNGAEHGELRSLSQELLKKLELKSEQLQAVGVTPSEVFGVVRSESYAPNHHLDNRAVQGLLPMLLANHPISKKILFSQRIAFPHYYQDKKLWKHYFNTNCTRCVSWGALFGSCSSMGSILTQMELENCRRDKKHLFKNVKRLILWVPQTGEKIDLPLHPEEKGIAKIIWLSKNELSNCFILFYTSGKKELVDASSLANIQRRFIENKTDFFAREEGIDKEQEAFFREKEETCCFAKNAQFFIGKKKLSNARWSALPILESREPSNIHFWNPLTKSCFYKLAEVCNFEVKYYDNATVVFGYYDYDEIGERYAIEFWDVETHTCIKKLFFPEFSGGVGSWYLFDKNNRHFVNRGFVDKNLKDFSLWGLCLGYQDGGIISPKLKTFEYVDLLTEQRCNNSIYQYNEHDARRRCESFFMFPHYIVSEYFHAGEPNKRPVNVFAADTFAFIDGFSREDAARFVSDAGTVPLLSHSATSSEDIFTVHWLPALVLKQLALLQPEQVALILDIATALDNEIPLTWQFLTEAQRTLLSDRNNLLCISIQNMLKKNVRLAQKHVRSNERKAMAAAADTALLLPRQPLPWWSSSTSWLKRQSRRWPAKLLLAAVATAGVCYGWRKWGRSFFNLAKA